MRVKRGAIVLLIIVLGAFLAFASNVPEPADGTIVQNCPVGTSAHGAPVGSDTVSHEMGLLCASRCPGGECVEGPKGCFSCKAGACDSKGSGTTDVAGTSTNYLGAYPDAITCGNFCPTQFGWQCVPHTVDACSYICVKEANAPAIGSFTAAGITYQYPAPIAPAGPYDTEQACKNICTESGEVCIAQNIPSDSVNSVEENGKTYSVNAKGEKTQVTFKCEFRCSRHKSALLDPNTCASFCPEAGKTCNPNVETVTRRGVQYTCGQCEEMRQASSGHAAIGSGYLLGMVSDQPTGNMLAGSDVNIILSSDRLQATAETIPIHRSVGSDADGDGIVDSHDKGAQSPRDRIVLVNGIDSVTYQSLFETNFRFNEPDEDDERFGIDEEIRVALAEEIIDDTLVATIGVTYADHDEVILVTPYEEGENRYDHEFTSGGLDFELRLRWELDDEYLIDVRAEPPEVETSPAVLLDGLTFYNQNEQRQYSGLFGISAFEGGQWGFHVYARQWKTGILDENGQFAQFLAKGSACHEGGVACEAGTMCASGICSSVVPVGQPLTAGYDYPADHAVQDGVSIARDQATELLTFYDTLDFEFKATKPRVQEGDELASYLQENLEDTPIAFIGDAVECYETWRYRIRMTTLNLLAGGNLADSLEIMFGNRESS